ncbi:craniofacial development protein 2-like [Amphiura filiformis]|uniref:craniofacial development protein 2-like n=1 Tax=Amphiura filiformis TaxID=82378 RepID=UPI003B21D43F
MEVKVKRGRNARGQYGRNHQRKDGCRLPSHDSEANTSYDVLQPKLKGRCKIDESHMSGQRSINICTYNTRTLRTEESLESLIDELRDLKWDIIGLSETKRAGEGIEELKGGVWLYNHGKTEDNRNAKGIGFMIHPKFKDYIREIKYYSNRVVSLDVQLTANNHLCVVQVYAPTSEYEDEAVEEMYEDVSKAMEESRATYTIVMGDFNAKIGRRQSGEESIMGRYGIGERNRRGEMLLEYATQQNLVIANTFFKKKENRYWTWESPGGKIRNQIDFVLSSQRGILQNCEVITNVDIGSDHRMIRAKILLNKKLARLKFIKNSKKSKLNIMRLKERRKNFN